MDVQVIGPGPYPDWTVRKTPRRRTAVEPAGPRWAAQGRSGPPWAAGHYYSDMLRVAPRSAGHCNTQTCREIAGPGARRGRRPGAGAARSMTAKRLGADGLGESVPPRPAAGDVDGEQDQPGPCRSLRATCMPPMLMPPSPSMRPPWPTTPGPVGVAEDGHVVGQIGTSRSKPLIPTTFSIIRGPVRVPATRHLGAVAERAAQRRDVAEVAAGRRRSAAAPRRRAARRAPVR